MSESIETRCDQCQYVRLADNPIPHCPGCEKEAYWKAFGKLVETAEYAVYLGHDYYRDAHFFWRDGHVIGIEGRFERMVRHKHGDELVARIADLEAENKDLLAENARLRRRLEGAPCVREARTK